MTGTQAEDPDRTAIDTVRTLAMDAVEKAGSGHPGTAMALAPAAYVLWTRFLKFDPEHPDWFDRDRFVLSNGHASILQYSVLHLTGYDVPLDELKKLRTWDGITPGHPEHFLTPGVEVTTGPLGQGVGNGVGFAMAEKFLAARYNKPAAEVVDHRTWVFAGDGDLMEGVSAEASSIAGHLKLGKLTVLYDDNHITIDGTTELSFDTEDKAARYRAYGWHVIEVEDANDLEAIADAYQAAIDETERPTFIRLRSHIAWGAPNAHDTSAAHGSALGEDEIRLTKQAYGWDPDQHFVVPDAALQQWRQAVPRHQRARDKWEEQLSELARVEPGLAEELEAGIAGRLPQGWDADLDKLFTEPKDQATRKWSGAVLNALASKLPTLIGGSADLAESNNTDIKGGGDYLPSGPGRILHYGIREHGMGAISNGLALHGGIRPFAATFLVFSDYMRPSVRLASLMNLPVVYVWTHDSLGLGGDGPTHQPVEHLAALRAIPHLHVMRPADGPETAEAWRSAMLRTDGPTALALTRQNLPWIDRNVYASAEGLHKGGYILAEAERDGQPTAPELIIMATGSEVHLALEARERLQGDGSAAVRVVSMPCWELFEAQDQAYIDEVLPPAATARVAIEAASPFGWAKWTGTAGDIVGVSEFGHSAPGEEVLERYGINTDNLVSKARAVLERATRAGAPDQA
jgi:transketolase